MRSVPVIPSVLATLALVVPGTCELTLHESDAPAILQLGVRRNHVSDPIQSDRRRFKRGTVDVKITGYGMSGDLYSANLTLGSPPQQIEVSVDTGSSDLWVVESQNSVCSYNGAHCDSFGTYNPLNSDSYNPLDESFSIEYGDESWAEGFYATDQLQIAGATIPDIQFGVATLSSIDKGILGLGYPTNVAAAQIYLNFPQLLTQNRITNSNAYSLWLNRLGEDEGNVLFGGVNTALFIGDLHTFPVVPYSNNYYHLWVTLTGLGVNSASDDIEKTYESADLPVVVLLDSGASISYLPADIVQKIYSDLDVQFYEAGQFGYVPCDSYLNGKEDYNLTFTFSDLTITVPLQELVLLEAIYYEGDFLDVNGERGCAFGIAPSADFFPILGDSFLRSAYVVFDLDNNEISMAQANFNPGKDHILEIGVGSNAVPGATPAPNPITTVAIDLSGSSLVLPPGYSNTPIFPSETSTEESTTASPTPSYSDVFLPTFVASHDSGPGAATVPPPTASASNDNGSESAATATTTTMAGLAAIHTGSPSLLVMGAAGAGMVLLGL